MTENAMKRCVVKLSGCGGFGFLSQGHLHYGAATNQSQLDIILVLCSFPP
jgi:hypothetical protein